MRKGPTSYGDLWLAFDELYGSFCCPFDPCTNEWLFMEELNDIGWSGACVEGNESSHDVLRS